MPADRLLVPSRVDRRRVARRRRQPERSCLPPARRPHRRHLRLLRHLGRAHRPWPAIRRPADVRACLPAAPADLRPWLDPALRDRALALLAQDLARDLARAHRRP
ncbi:hypothetical protein SSBR45G_19160 [Bradyrhizobium sp. SSBR45G]|nr:hypothetical protein SSBR45G_19160 [Bradyrhizobium sp. SSBR45G]GLH83766.1 hypothetical protein SSBR45R_12260 [Bradyrhizobium sp. SSBR45R]